MKIIKLASKGPDVERLQRLLGQWGYTLPVTGKFGPETEQVVRKFQQLQKLAADGIVGKATWASLEKPDHIPPGCPVKKDVPADSLKLTEADFVQAARLLNIHVAAVKAVQAVETGGRGGFSAPGKPVILFEGHVFWEQLKRRGIKPELHVSGNEDILYPSWTTRFYKSGLKEYERLERAVKIDEIAALCSASYGMFQIMGFNYPLCGCASVYELWKEMSASEGKQLELFVRFVRKNQWDGYLRKLDFAGFARRYNGAGYAKNKYDVKLQQMYRKYLG